MVMPLIEAVEYLPYAEFIKVYDAKAWEFTEVTEAYHAAKRRGEQSKVDVLKAHLQNVAFNQDIISEQLNTYLKQQRRAASSATQDPDLMRLWLYMRSNGDAGWLFNALARIANWDGRSDISTEANAILKISGEIRNAERPVLQLGHRFRFSFANAELPGLLPDLIPNKKMVQIACNNKVLAVYCEDGYFQVYDGKHWAGSHTVNSIEELQSCLNRYFQLGSKPDAYHFFSFSYYEHAHYPRHITMTDHYEDYEEIAPRLYASEAVIARSLSRNHNLERKDVHGRSILANTIAMGDRAMVKRLIALGVNVNEADPMGTSLLQFAFEKDYFGIARDLVAAGAVERPDAAYYNGYGRLQAAIIAKNYDKLSLLLSFWVNINEVDSEIRQSPLTCAICAKDERAIAMLLADLRIRVSGSDLKAALAVGNEVLYQELLRRFATYPNATRQASILNEPRIVNDLWSLGFKISADAMLGTVRLATAYSTAVAAKSADGIQQAAEYSAATVVKTAGSVTAALGQALEWIVSPRT